MASSKSEVKQKINYPKEPKIKYVKKANAWVRTTFEKSRTGYIQHQEWSVEKPQ